MNSDEQIQLAMLRHQAGDLEAAEKIYRQILDQEPNDPDALRLLGIVENQRGNLHTAFDLVGRAIRIKPDDSKAHRTLAGLLAQKGRFDEAIANYRKALEFQWDDAGVHRDLGSVLGASGRLEEAAASFSNAVHIDPNDALAYNGLGSVRLRQNRFDEAIAACSKAIAINGRFAEAHGNLGDALRGKGMAQEALAAYRRALHFKSGYFEALQNLGNLLRDLGKFDEATAAYLKAIQLQPGNPMPQFNLATAYHTVGRLEEALAAYGNAVAARADFLEAHVNMAIVLANLQRFDEALACHAKAAALKPEAGMTHLAMGEILLWQQETAAAIEHFRRSVAADPKLFMAWSELGAALRAQGKFDEAADCFRKTLEIRPNSAAAYNNLVSTGKVEFSPEEIKRLTAILNQPNLSVPDRLSLGFALGKALDDLERYDEAFAYYTEANALAKRLRALAAEQYDPEAAHRQIDELIEMYTPSFFQQRRDWGDPSEIPVFVLGMPRSGTTLVQQIAASHPQVYGAGELMDIGILAVSLGGTDVKSAAPGWKRELIKKAAQQHLHHLREMNPTAWRIIDKMPDNVLGLGFISVLFPRARVILCRRDARDNCLSCFFQLFSSGNTFSFDLAHCGHWYKEVDRLAAHWCRAVPLEMMEIQYEAMVADLEGQSRRLIEFLGLPWDPACLEFYRTQNAVLTSSVWQVRQPIYTRSAGRWRHYEKHLGPLLEVLGRQDTKGITP